MTQHTKQMTVRLGEHEVDADVEYEITPFVPARITADPYNSSPAEGGDVEILKVTHKTRNVETGQDEIVDLTMILPAGEEERLRTCIFENEVMA